MYNAEDIIAFLRSKKFTRIAQHLALIIIATADPVSRAVRLSSRDLEELTGWGKSTIADHLSELDGFFTIIWGDGSGKLAIYLPDADGDATVPHPAYNPALSRYWGGEPGKGEMRDLAIVEFGHVCSHCGLHGDCDVGPDGRPWSLDRIVPGAYGGIYEARNVTLSCLTCNISRGAAQLSSPVFSLADCIAARRAWLGAWVNAGAPSGEEYCA